jgi:hypothetical protein
MVDLAEIDRQLAALGKVPQDLAALIARELGDGASPERRDAWLSEQGAGSFQPLQASAPERHSSRPSPIRETWDRPITAPPPNQPEADAPRSLDPGSMHAVPPPAFTEPPDENDEPELSFSEQAAAEEAGGYYRDVIESDPPHSSQPAPRRSWSWPGSGRDSSRPPRPSWPPEGVRKSSAAEHEAATALTPMAELPPAATERAELDALLDQDLDPNDFPRTEPPPAEQAAAAESEDDFEMLIEDDEIIELDDNELEDVE